MEDKDFFEQIHISRKAFNDLLAILKSNGNNYEISSGVQQVPLEDALLMTLWYLASKTTFRELGNTFGYHVGSIHKVFYKLINIIINIDELKFSWPQELATAESAFYRLSGLPGIVAAMDTIHIRVRPPSAVKKDYLCNKCVNTMILLAACDADMKFTVIATGFPGSMHDHEVMNSTVFGQELKHWPNKYFDNREQHVVANCAFSLQMNVLVPYPATGELTQTQIHFNEKHEQSRQVIKRAFGMLKTRFKSLTVLDMDIEHISPIIHACCVIHNFALRYADVDKVYNDVNRLEILTNDARVKRDFIASAIMHR